MAIKHLLTEKLPLTKQLAQEFAGMTMRRGERQLSPSRVAWLLSLHMQGKFHSPRWRSCFVKSISRMVRVDGQHSSSMLSEMSEASLAGMEAIIDRYECDTEDDLVDLFAMFDSPRSVRSSRDLIRCAASLHDEYREIDDNVVLRLLNGIVYFNAVMENPARPTTRPYGREERAKLIATQKEFIHWAAQLATKKHMRWDCVLAAVMATYIRDRDAALQFWSLVRDEDGPIDGPVRTLANYLREIKTVQVAQQHEMNGKRACYVKCLHAWNAWRTGETTRLRYFKSTDIPEVL